MSKPRPWIRLYVELLHNRKFRAISEKNQLRCIKFWLLHSRGHLVGSNDEAIADDLHISVSEVKKTRDALIIARLLDKDGKPHEWNSWQYASDTSTERVRKHRRNVSETFHGTGSGRFGNAPEQSRAEQSRKEAPFGDHKGQDELGPDARAKLKEWGLS